MSPGKSGSALGFPAARGRGGRPQFCRRHSRANGSSASSLARGRDVGSHTVRHDDDIQVTCRWRVDRCTVAGRDAATDLVRFV
jgi:hypothetical protein